MKILKVILLILMFAGIGLGLDYYFYTINKKIEKENETIPNEIPDLINYLDNDARVSNIYDKLSSELLLRTLKYNNEINYKSLTNEDILSIGYSYLKMDEKKDLISCELLETIKQKTSLNLENQSCNNLSLYYNLNDKNVKYLIKAAISKMFGSITYNDETFKINNNNECIYINEDYVCYEQKVNTCLPNPNIIFDSAKIYNNKIELYVKYLVDACNEYYVGRVYYADNTLKNLIIPKKEIPNYVLNPVKNYGVIYKMTFTKNVDDFIWNKSILENN